MEEDLQYMKTLRYQLNDVKDHAAKISVEEQMQITTILEKDLDLGMASHGTSQNFAIAERFNKQQRFIKQKQKTPVTKPISLEKNFIERKKAKNADLRRAKARDKKMSRMQA